MINKANKYYGKDKVKKGDLHADQLIDFEAKRDSGLLEDQGEYYIQLKSQIRKLQAQFAIEDELQAMTDKLPAQITPSEYLQREHFKKQEQQKEKIRKSRKKRKRKDFTHLRVSKPSLPVNNENSTIDPNYSHVVNAQNFAVKKVKYGSTELPPPMYPKAKPELEMPEIEFFKQKKDENEYKRGRSKKVDKDDPLTKSARRKSRGFYA
eukprot:UN28835